MDIKNKKAVVVAVITFLDLFVNIVNNVRIAENSIGVAVIGGILLALCDMLLLFSIIELANKPVLSMVLLTLAQTFTLIYSLFDEDTFVDACYDIGIMGVMVLSALTYHSVSAYKKVSKDKELVKTFKDKVKNTVNYKRAIYSIKIPVRIIIYSMIISSTLSLAGSDMLNVLNNSISFRIYSAFVLVIPSMLVLGIITTSYIAYDIFIAKILFEAYTLYLLVSIGKFDLVQIIYIIVEVIAIVYAYFVTFRDNGKKVEEKRGKKKEQEKYGRRSADGK